MNCVMSPFQICTTSRVAFWFHRECRFLFLLSMPKCSRLDMKKDVAKRKCDDNLWIIVIIIRRNPSGGSGLSETGSLDRAKAALERRKKAEDGTGNPILCRVEVTRPNPDSLIDELLKATNLEQTDLESSESTHSLRHIFLSCHYINRPKNNTYKR